MPHKNSVDYGTIATTYTCSILSLIIILTRLFWRYRRGERMYSDDFWMGIALVPLLIRMPLINICTLFLTTRFDRGAIELEEMDATEMKKRIIGSKLILVVRICYSGFVWCMKVCVLGFYERVTGKAKPYGLMIDILYGTLALTYIAVVLSTLLECRPFYLYWQIAPDPGRCVYADAQLLTMGMFNIATDIALIILPLPLVFKSRLPLTRKLQLALLFGVGIFLVAITIARLPIIIDDNSIQKTRTLWASIEILASCIVSNAPVLHALIQKIRRHPGDDYNLSSYEQRRRMRRPVTGQDSIGSLTRNDDGLTSIIETRTEVVQKIDIDPGETIKKSHPLKSPWRGDFLGTQVWSDGEFQTYPAAAATNKSAV